MKLAKDRPWALVEMIYCSIHFGNEAVTSLDVVLDTIHQLT